MPQQPLNVTTTVVTHEWTGQQLKQAINEPHASYNDDEGKGAQ